MAHRIAALDGLHRFLPDPTWFTIDPAGIHGVTHAARVLAWAAILAAEVAPSAALARDELLWAAALHDVARRVDGDDPDHGARAGCWVREQFPSHRPRVPATLNLDVVADLCAQHDRPLHDAPRPTLELVILKDADALDRVRRGALDSGRLRLAAAARLIAPAGRLARTTARPGVSGRDTLATFANLVRHLPTAAAPILPDVAPDDPHAALAAADPADRLRLLTGWMTTGTLSRRRLVELIASWWQTIQYPSETGVARVVWLLRRAGFVADTPGTERPAVPLTLYRCEPKDTERLGFGLSWATTPHVAELLAGVVQRAGRYAHIVTAVAPPDAVLAHFGAFLFAEIVVDPRRPRSVASYQRGAAGLPLDTVVRLAIAKPERFATPHAGAWLRDPANREVIAAAYRDGVTANGRTHGGDEAVLMRYALTLPAVQRKVHALSRTGQTRGGWEQPVPTAGG